MAILQTCILLVSAAWHDILCETGGFTILKPLRSCVVARGGVAARACHAALLRPGVHRANIVVGGIQKNLASRPPGWREECGRGRSRPGDERARVQQGRNQSSGLDGRGGAVSRSGVHFGPKRGGAA